MLKFKKSKLLKLNWYAPTLMSRFMTEEEDSSEAEDSAEELDSALLELSALEDWVLVSDEDGSLAVDEEDSLALASLLEKSSLILEDEDEVRASSVHTLLWQV